MSRRFLAAVISCNVMVATYAAVTWADDSPRAGDASVARAAQPAPTSSTTSVPSTTTAPPTTTTQAPTTTAPPAPPPARPADARLAAFRGLGVWIDVFDFSPAYMQEGEPSPVVTPAHVDEMAARGVKTIYIQAARDDERTPGLIESPDVVGQFLVRAHAHGIKVVGWFLPKKYDDSDLARFRAMREFRFEGHAFDAIGNDIEFRGDVPDVAERNRRLVDLSKRLRAESGDVPIAAIVLPPVVTDIINPAFWPDFPWAEIAPYYDVWMPMAYWTNRKASSEWRDAHRYVTANVEMVRAHIGMPDAPVHPIGGIGDASTIADYEGFLRAAHEQRSIGASVYDYRTTAPDAWPVLQGSPG